MQWVLVRIFRADDHESPLQERTADIVTQLKDKVKKFVVYNRQLLT